MRGGRVWLRALAGLEPVDVVLRRMEDGDADPLELGRHPPRRRPPACAGPAPGGRARAGVGVANALGAGIAGDVGAPGLPPGGLRAAARRAPPAALAADAVAAATRTSGAEALGRPRRAGAARHAPAAPSPSVFAGRLDDARARRPGSPPSPPTRAASSPSPRSSSPRRRCCDGRRRRPRHRGRAHPGRESASASGWVALPGGLGRVVDDDDARAGADAAARPRTCGCWPTTATDAPARRGRLAAAVPQVDLRTSLPSRAAEALFWVGRNAERAEAVARVALALLHALRAVTRAGRAGRRGLARRAVAGPAGRSAAAARRRRSREHARRRPRRDAAGRRAGRAGRGPRRPPGALADSLGHLAKSAGSVREFLSTQHLAGRRAASTHDGWRWPPTRPRPTSFVVAESLDDVVLSLMALAGLAAESIVRGPGWRFLDLGRRLERALLLLGLVEAMVVPPIGPHGRRTGLRDAAAACESLVAYRRRYRSDLELDAALRPAAGRRHQPAVARLPARPHDRGPGLPPRSAGAATTSSSLVEDANRLVLGAAWLEGHERRWPAAPNLGLQQSCSTPAAAAPAALADAVVARWFAHVGRGARRAAVATVTALPHPPPHRLPLRRARSPAA